MTTAAVITAAVFIVTGCTSAPEDPATSGQDRAPVGTVASSVGPPSTSSALRTSSSSAAVSTTPVPTSYVPPPDGPAVTEPCPYLTTAQVVEAAGDAVSAVRTIAGGVYPACVFLADGGRELATIRVLTFESGVQAALAVDHYLPVDKSSLETRPPGWEGGSMRSSSGSVVGIHKNGVAVIVTADGVTQPARHIARQAIANLGL